MEPQLQQQKFLTLECEGRSCISSTPPAPRERSAPGYLPHLCTLRPASEGTAAESPCHCWPTFYTVCREIEGERQLGAGELTSGLAGPWVGRAQEEWPGLGDSMRGPWTERRSWDCPACVRCGQPCSRCSPAEPKETGCECGGSRGARVCGNRGGQPRGTYSCGGGRGARTLRRVT